MKILIRKTKNRIRMGSSFWTQRGVKQECFLSLCMFNLMIAVLEAEDMKKGGCGGVRLKTYSGYF